VSARHAEITHIGGDMYRLTDLGSSNGTFVNGQRIQSATVKLGDLVSFGTFQADLRAYVHLVPQGRQAVIGPDGQPVQPHVSSPPGWQQAPPVQAPVVPKGAVVQHVPAAQPTPPQEQPVQPVSKEPAPVHPAPPQRQSVNQPGMGTELAVALAAQQSFVGKAFICWFLYWLLYLPGLVMNIAWLSEANRVKKLTGQAPSGTGCLQFLLFKFVFLPILVVILVLATGGAFLTGLMSMF
jgi:hypothetical protein